MSDKIDYSELIKNRRSIRAYDPDKVVAPELLKQILEAGILAPTAKNLQPGRFILVTDRKKLDEVCTAYGRDWLKNAPAILIVLGNHQDAWVRSYDGFNSLQIDLTIMMDHMILAAEAAGIATCWICAFDEKVLRQKLDIAEDEFICAMTPLGYPPEDYVKRQMPLRKTFEEMATILD